MLSSLLKEHQQRQHLRKEEQDKKKREAIAASNALTSAMVDHLNVGVAQAYLNQKKLDAETKQLHANSNNFAKQTTQWLHLIDNFNHALKYVYTLLKLAMGLVPGIDPQDFYHEVHWFRQFICSSLKGEYFMLLMQELGDVENWAKSIEADMRTVSSALEYAYKVGQEGP